MADSHAELHAYPVWDRPTRLFHWVNALCVLALLGIGLVILNAKTLGIPTEGKVVLKGIHVWVGYLFTVNLLWRFAWAFMGNRYARWRAILPGGRGYLTALRAYTGAFMHGHPPPYLGHNPLARIMVALMFVLLLIQAVTGLVLAGTDLYAPPLGHEIAEWVTGAGEDHSKLEGLRPGSMEGVDPEAYQAMRAFRAPFAEVHEAVAIVLLILVLLHVTAVVVTEIREGGGLVSAMFTGRKVFDRRPVDEDEG